MKRLHEANIPKELFDYTPPPHTKTMARAEYFALREAAKVKGVLPKFIAWQRNLKIIFKD